MGLEKGRRKEIGVRGRAKETGGAQERAEKSEWGSREGGGKKVGLEEGRRKEGGTRGREGERR